MREHIELDRLIQQCFEAGQDVCSPRAEPHRAVLHLRVHRAVPGHRAVLAESEGRRKNAAARLRAGMEIADTRMTRRRGCVLAAVLLAAAWSAIAGAQSSRPRRSSSTQSSSPATPPKKSPWLKLVEPWPAPEVMTQRRSPVRGPAALQQRRAVHVHARDRLQGAQPGPRSRKPEALPRRAASPGTRRSRGLAARSVERARPLAAESAHLRLRAHPGRVPQDGPRQHGVRAPGGAEARRAVRPRRRLRAVPAAGVSGVSPFQRHHATSPSARGSPRSPTSIARRARRPAPAPPCSSKTWTTSPNGWRGAAWTLPRLLFKDVDTDTLMPMMLHEYMIGNTDFSIHALHNVKIVQRPDKSLHPIPYDFDYFRARPHAVRGARQDADAPVGPRPALPGSMPAAGAGGSLRGELRRQEGPAARASRCDPRPGQELARGRRGRTWKSSIRRSRRRGTCGGCSSSARTSRRCRAPTFPFVREL